MKAFLSRDGKGYNLTTTVPKSGTSGFYSLSGKSCMFLAFPIRRFHAMFGIRLKLGEYQQIDMAKGKVKLLGKPVKAN